MKKMILYLMLITCVFFSQFSFAANVDDDDDGEEIIIEYADPGEGVNRGIIDIPFQVIYYNQQSCVTIAFTNNIGEITISLTNLLNSSSTNTVIDSRTGQSTSSTGRSMPWSPTSTAPSSGSASRTGRDGSAWYRKTRTTTPRISRPHLSSPSSRSSAAPRRSSDDGYSRTNVARKARAYAD